MLYFKNNYDKNQRTYMVTEFQLIQNFVCKDVLVIIMEFRVELI